MRSGMARVLKRSHSFTCTPRVHPPTEWTIPAFAFLAETGTHLATTERWKAELAFCGERPQTPHRRKYSISMSHLFCLGIKHARLEWWVLYTGQTCRRFGRVRRPAATVRVSDATCTRSCSSAAGSRSDRSSSDWTRSCELAPVNYLDVHVVVHYI